jgi:hypothetical protein
MPLTPSFGDRLVGPVVRLYTKAEQAVFRWITDSLSGQSGHGPNWFQRMMLRIPRFRRGIAKIVTELEQHSRTTVADVLSKAWRTGSAAAHADASSAGALPDERALTDLINRVHEALAVAHRQIPAASENVYRRVVQEASRDVTAADDSARETIVRRALDRFAKLGITGFIDKRGRRYDLVSYVETTVRTAVSHAEIEAYTQRLVENGFDLIVVSDVPGACEICRPYEGAVLSISGSTVGAISRDNRTGHAVRVNVLCSLAEAREQGLFHRGCRHTIGLWTPDDPAPPRAVRASEADRAAVRRRRALERRERILQRRALVARSR